MPSYWVVYINSSFWFWFIYRTVCSYEMRRETKDFAFYGLYETGSTLKDVKSVAEIATSSGQTWDKLTRTKYKANTITAVKVSEICKKSFTQYSAIVCQVILEMLTPGIWLIIVLCHPYYSISPHLLPWHSDSTAPHI